MLKDSENSTHQMRRTHRTYTPAFKAQLVAACHTPGASIAALAHQHGMNANVLRKRPPIPVPHLNAAVGCDRSRHSGVVGLPAVRQQFVDPTGALRWQPREDILQVGIRVVPIHAG